jgi:hypothetical protein
MHHARRLVEMRWEIGACGVIAVALHLLGTVKLGLPVKRVDEDEDGAR